MIWTARGMCPTPGCGRPWRTLLAGGQFECEVGHHHRGPRTKPLAATATALRNGRAAGAVNSVGPQPQPVPIVAPDDGPWPPGIEYVDVPPKPAVRTRARAATVEMVTAPELWREQFPALREIVPGLLFEGAALLVARPKLGKSWLALGLSIAVATGGRALGTIDVDAGDVLYLALEDGPRRLQGRLKALTDRPPERLTFATEWPRFDQGGLAAAEAWLQAHPDARLLVVDTLARVRPPVDARASLYGGDYNALSGLADLSHRHRCAVVVVHHSRKQGSDDPLDTVSGSFGLTAAVDAILVMKRDSAAGGVSLSITGRDLPDRELAIRFDRDSLTWALNGNAEDARRSEIEKALRAALGAATDGLTPSEAAAATGLDHNRVKTALWRLADAGKLDKHKSRYFLPDGAVTAVTEKPTRAPGIRPAGGAVTQLDRVTAPVTASDQEESYAVTRVTGSDERTARRADEDRSAPVTASVTERVAVTDSSTARRRVTIGGQP